MNSQRRARPHYARMRVDALQMQIFDTDDDYDDSPYEPRRPIEVPGVWPRPGAEAIPGHKDKAPHEGEALTNFVGNPREHARSEPLGPGSCSGVHAGDEL